MSHAWPNMRLERLRLPKASPSRFRDACDALHDGAEAARRPDPEVCTSVLVCDLVCRIFGWASGVPGRLVGKATCDGLAQLATLNYKPRHCLHFWRMQRGLLA